MEPSEILVSTVDQAIKKLDATILRKWMELIARIPIFGWGYCILKKMRGWDYQDFGDDYETLFIAAFDSAPYVKEKKPADFYFLCYFYTRNKAKIDGYCTSQEHVKDIVPYGFEGTWEDVIKKVVELNDLLLQPVPQIPAISI